MRNSWGRNWAWCFSVDYIVWFSPRRYSRLVWRWYWDWGWRERYSVPGIEEFADSKSQGSGLKRCKRHRRTMGWWKQEVCEERIPGEEHFIGSYGWTSPANQVYCIAWKKRWPNNFQLLRRKARTCVKTGSKGAKWTTTFFSAPTICFSRLYTLGKLRNCSNFG